MGTVLIGVLARIAQASGVSFLEIAVTEENKRALALYRRLGFTPLRELALCDGRSALLLAKALAQQRIGAT
jgi:ribosomal protein S18 acetylase RimI-like enzyme